MSSLEREETNNQEQESGKYTLINAYEGVVRDNVRDFISRDPDMCRCEKCFLDVCALVLNNKRADYCQFVTTRKGELLSQVSQTSYINKAEMTVIVLDAIRMVKESPKHDS